VAFACATATVFNASGSPTRLFAQAPAGSGSAFTAVGGASGVQYNAIGFNTEDGLIYAVSGPNGGLAPGHLVVVDSSGAVFDRGAITGIPGAELARGVNAGSFDDAGGFWVAAGGSTASGRLYRVDLATRVAAPLVGQTAPVRALDVTFADGFLWGAGSANTVVRVDLASGAVTTIGVPALPAGPFPAAWTHPDGHLGFDSASGAVVELAVSQPGGAAPRFTLVRSSPGLAFSANDGTSCSPRPVDLAIDITGPTRRTAGSAVTWTLAVQNRGANASSGFVVKDVVPTGYTGISAATGGCSVTGSAVRCHGGGLAPGAHTVITITASAPRSLGCLTNTASVVGAEPDPISANNASSLRTCVRAPSGLTLVQTASLGTGRLHDGLARVGEVVTLTFLLNNADEEPVSAVSVMDRLARSGTQSLAVTCPQTSLAPGQSMRCSSSHAVAQADVDAASLTSNAVATGRSPEGVGVVSNSSTVTIPTFQSVGLSLARHVILVVDLNHNGRADPGDQVSWIIVATNTGTLTLHGVAVNDGLFTAAGIVVGCPRSTLAPARSMTCASAPHTATQSDVGLGLLGAAFLGSSTSSGEVRTGSLSRTPTGDPTSGGGEMFGSEGRLAFTGVSSGLGVALVLGLVLVLLGILLMTLGRRVWRG
jgi:uncharacterized repeat protein (TIGR01451 family)